MAGDHPARFLECISTGSRGRLAAHLGVVQHRVIERLERLHAVPAAIGSKGKRKFLVQRVTPRITLLLVVNLLALPVQGSRRSVQTAGASTTTPAPPATRPSTKAKTTAAGTSATPVKKLSAAAGTKASVHSVSANRTAAKRTSAAVRTSASSAAKGVAASKAASARSVQLTSAFLASTQLRPMAQQLASGRSAAAYAGVLSYAHSHPGDGAATAYLSLGHAYMLDHRYADAAAQYHQANQAGDVLDDYADYLGAQAAMQAGRPGDAYSLLDRFATRYPDSIFDATAPVMLANAHLQQHDGPGAVHVLEPLLDTDEASHADFRYALGKAYQLAGDAAHAAPIFRNLYVTQPLTYEAALAAAQMQAMGAPLAAAERKTHADALFNAKRYSEASAEYNAIGKNNPQLSPADRDALTIYATVCDFKLKHVGRREIEKLPETNDDTAALKLYMLAELSRSEDNRTEHDALIAQMIKRFPASRWLEEALYSGGNMYLLKHDSAQAIYHYSTLTTMFPASTYAPSAHWRAAWLSYRTRKYADAARLMDEQIQRYAGGVEVPSAIYWRGRIYEDEEHNFAQAANYYRAVSTAYADYYYALLARQRLAVLGTQPAIAPTVALSAVHKAAVPSLTGELPENDPHLIKARLLANAALNEYIGPEIQASPTSGQWGALGEAEIYASFGEYTRALQSMKHSGISFFTQPLEQVPSIYWHLLFPQPYWKELVADSGKNGLDPYLVAALIRQESEFNAGAVSRANAYGLMQLLPSVGKAMAKKDGLKGVDAKALLNPSTNLELGTTNLKLVLDRFGGQVEYALAAYNAGDTPIRQWLATNDYKDIPEFVESIPYTETREYVQAIMRNREIYRTIYPAR
jgi:soluble lytic murein transglycosylase